ncbi:MAG: hypothetical protein ACRDTU_22870 [Micromonosporaceae bacterium]
MTAATALLAVTIPAAPGHADPPGPPLGTVTDFGVQQTALTVFESHFGVGADGSPVTYGVQMGSPGVLAAVDPVTRGHLDTVPLEGASGAWAVTQASDGSVYAGSYPNAHVYRYDPASGDVTDLGAPVPGQTVLYAFQAGHDGRIYGGTYPDAHVFSYSPAEGFRDLGRMYDGEQYAIDVAVDPDRQVVWTAIGSHGHLIRYDLRTGEKRDILPQSWQGSANHPYDINLIGGYLFVKTSKSDAFVLDADTGEAAPMTDGTTGDRVASFKLSSRGTARLAPDGRSVYYSWGYDLYRYDLTTHTFAPVRDSSGNVVKPGGPSIGWGWIDGSLYAAVGNYGGDAFRYDPATGASESFKLPFPPQPLDINNITAGPDGRVYTNLYINGNMAVLDPETGTTTNVGRVGQTEGWIWHEGKLYLGTYPTGRVMDYDPDQPYQSGTNPRELFSLQAQHAQNRPIAFATTPDKLYVGTTPDYGEWGGALTAYDMATGEYTVQRHIVQDQGVISLARLGGTLWGGTRIDGGGGTEPKATEAKLFAVDVATDRKIGEYVPVPGADLITSVTEGPDGRVWGLADSTLFVFDPASRQVIRRVELPAVPSGAQDEMFLNPDGYVYASLDGKLFRVAPASLRYVTVRDAETYRLTQDPQGNLWFRNGVKAANGAVLNGARLLRYTPSRDARSGSPGDPN